MPGEPRSDGAPEEAPSSGGRPDWTALPDLASREHGGTVVAVSDEFFAAADRLLLPQAPEARPGVFDDRGQWMDGWESRRRRGPGTEDWAVVRLGIPGVVHGAVVDTAFFRGNHPETAALDGTSVGGNPSPDEVLAADWEPLLPESPLGPSAAFPYEVTRRRRVTHVRLRMAPDGGIARLRVHGVAVPDPRELDDAGLELTDPALGAEVVACSDMRFGRRANLIAPGLPRTMGEGWETRRRREPGAEWAVVRLAVQGRVRRLVVDTRHFRGNAPASCDVEASTDGAGWRPVVTGVRLQPDQEHRLRLPAAAAAGWLRLTIHPDGGVARFRAWGAATAAGRSAAALRWLDLLGAAEARRELLSCCGSTAWAAAVAAGRPYADLDALLARAADVWAGLAAEDWREALAAHPRIGDRPVTGTQEQREQSSVEHADSDELSEMAAGNRAYEERFGMTYVVRATGRSAGEMLGQLQQRLANDPGSELAVAAAQQAEITALRLRRLVLGGSTP